MCHSTLRSIAACLGALYALGSASASAAVSDFTGTWTNADLATRGITQVSIRVDGNQMFVHVWGKCHPSDCDWGEQPAQLFAPNVGVPVEAGADAAIVQFDQGANQTMLLLQTSTNGLSFKSFTIFGGATTRSNYHQSGHFVRQ